MRDLLVGGTFAARAPRRFITALVIPSVNELSCLIGREIVVALDCCRELHIFFCSLLESAVYESWDTMGSK